MITLSLIINVFFLALLTQAAKRAKQYKEILNRVAPADPEYLSMIVQKRGKK